MTALTCKVCLDPLPAGETYHRRCIQRLFGSSRVPIIDVEQSKLHTLAGVMVKHTSISGTQRKISLGFTQDRARLRVPDVGGEYILKPQTGTYPALPENEQLTMQLGALFGLEIPPCGLVTLADDSLAYIVARFDRPTGGGKLRQEDFCQLAIKSPKEKYTGSAELCARLIRRYSGQPGIDLSKLYRQWVFSWWTSNGDLHLKNLALVSPGAGSADRVYRLSPAYDLLCTRLVIDDDPMALKMGGRDRRFTRSSWMAFARYCGIPARAADRILGQPRRLLARAERLVERSYLPDAMKRDYILLLRERSDTFVA
jgi:serine/threonine-protein kinase HipA